MSTSPLKWSAKTKYRTLVLVVALVGVSVLLAQMLVEKNAQYDPCSSDDEKMNRAQARGQTDPATTSALMGMIMGNSLGYVLDSMAMDRGFMVVNHNFPDAMKLSMGRVWDGSFMRYIITVLLDTFITISLFNVLFPQIITLPYLKEDRGITQSLLTAFLGVTTFFVYTNATRFAYAYPDPGTDPATWIRPTTIAFATVLGGLTFLVTSTPGNTDGINKKSVKSMLYAGTLMLLAAISFFEVDEETPESAVRAGETGQGDAIVEVVQNKTKSMDDHMDAAVKGFVTFTVIVVGCTLFTARTAKTPHRKKFFFVVAASVGAVLASLGGLITLSPRGKIDGKSYSEHWKHLQSSCSA